MILSFDEVIIRVPEKGGGEKGEGEGARRCVSEEGKIDGRGRRNDVMDVGRDEGWQGGLEGEKEVVLLWNIT